MSVLIQGTQVPVTADGLSSGNVSSTAGTSLELHALRARNYWWNVVQDTQFGSSDTGVSLVYDSVGNMYVYGLVHTPNGNGTLALKFNSEGYLQWRKSYTDANGFACGGNDGIAIDSHDNLYFMANDSVTAVFYAGTMDAEGNISPTYISLAQGEAYDLAVDNSANMYFTGGLTDTGNGQGFAAKVDSSSNTLVWTTSLRPANPSFIFQGTAIAVQDSNVYVSGNNPNIGSYLLQMDSSSGTINWQQQISDSTNAEAVSTDALGNAYVLVSNVNEGTAVYKVDVNGTSIWQTVLDGGFNSSYTTTGYDAVPDNQGHVYVLGTTQAGSTQYNALFISKLSADTGTMLWSHTIGYSFEDTVVGTINGLRVGSVHVDRIGITGYISGPFPAVAFTAQVPTDGSLVGKWYGAIGSASYNDVTPAWLANTYTQNYTFSTGDTVPHYNQGNLTIGVLDLTTLAIPAANVVSITTTIGTVADYQSTITLTTDGQTTVPGDLSLGGEAPLGWISSMSNVSIGGQSHYSEFRYVMGDASGVYAMGDDFYDGPIPYMVKYDHNGAVLWQKQATYDGHEGVTGRIIQAQPYGADNLIVLGDGYDFNPPGHEGVIVALVSTIDGSASYPLSMLSPSNYDLVPNSIAVGPGAPGTGNVYIAGYAATNSYNNAWLINLRDRASAGYGDFTGNAEFRSVTTDATGNVYAGGQWYNGSNYEDIVVKIPSDLGTPIWGVSILPLYSDGRNGAVMVDDSTNSLFVTTYWVGHPRLSKLDAATGEGIWITEIGNVYGGSEGGVLTPDGDVILAGWTPGPWNPGGPEGMLFSRVSGSDGSVMWSNALYTTTLMGGGNYFWNNNSSTIGLISDTHFGAGGWQTLDGAEGAVAVKLPLDGTGQGTYGPYIYASYATVGVTTSLATTPRTVGITTTPVTFFAGGDLIAATVRANQFELDLIGGSGQQGVGSINNILALNFDTGGAISEQRHNNTTIMDINSAENGGVSVNSWSGNSSNQAFSQLMWANTEITTETYNGFPDNAYNWVYTDSAGFHIENHPNGFAGQGYTWQFDLTGNLSLPTDGGLAFSNGTINTVGGGINVRTYNGSFTVSVDETQMPTVPYVAWTFDQSGVLTLPLGSIIGETANTTVISPPGALMGQSLVIRPTAVQIITSNYPSGFADGDSITLTIDPNNGGQVTGTVGYTFTGATAEQLGCALTGTLTFTDQVNQTLTWTIPALSNIDSFTFTLGAPSGFVFGGPGNTYITLTRNGSSEDYHIHLVTGDPATTDIYLGDDDQYVKIEKNAGNVVVGTNANTNQWTFGTDGNLTLPTVGGIVNNGNVWNFGADGSLAFPNATGFANSQIYTTNGGYQTVFETFGTSGDRGAGQKLTLDYDDGSVKIQSYSSPNTVEWKFGQYGALTLPDGGYIDNNGGITRLGAGNLGAQIGSADTQNYVTASNEGVTIQTQADIANSNWVFDLNGYLTMPLHTRMNSGGVGNTNSAEFGTVVNTYGDNGVVQNSQIYMSAGTGEARILVNMEGHTLVYYGTEEVENPNFTGMVAMDPNVRSQYAIASENGNILLGGAQPGGTLISSDYIAGIGSLNNNYNMNGLYVDSTSVLISTGSEGAVNNSQQFGTNGISTTTTFGNISTNTSQAASYWLALAQDSTTGLYPAQAKIDVCLANIDTPEVYIDLRRASDGFNVLWTFDNTGNLTLPQGGTINWSDGSNALVGGGGGGAYATTVGSFGSDLGIGPNYDSNNPALLYSADDMVIRTGGNADTPGYGQMAFAASETAQIGVANSLATSSNLGSIDFWSQIKFNNPAYDPTINVVIGSTTWGFSSDGVTAFPGYSFTATDGTAGQMLATNGSGSVTWTTPPGPNGNANTGNITFSGSNIASSTNADIALQSNGFDLVFAASSNGGALVLPDYQGTGGYGTLTASTPDSGVDIYTNEQYYSEVWLKALSQGGNVWISTYGETYVWDFDITGNLTLPVGGTINFADGSNALVGGGAVNTGNITFSGNTIGTSNAGNIVLSTNSKTWTFGADGIATIPGGSTIQDLGYGYGSGHGLWLNTAYNGNASALFQDSISNQIITQDYNNGHWAVINTQFTGGNSSHPEILLITNPGNGLPKNDWILGSDGTTYLPSNSVITSHNYDTGNVTTVGSNISIRTASDGPTFHDWTFGSNGNLTFPDATVQPTAYQRTTGTWNVTVGSNTYSFTVPGNDTYSMWVRGQVTNGIIVWNATATVTNTNVPVIGQQFAWNYTGGGTPLEITAIPTQFIGTAGVIVSSNPSVGTTSNVFDFVIYNNSGSPQTVYWGYVIQ